MCCDFSSVLHSLINGKQRTVHVLCMHCLLSPSRFEQATLRPSPASLQAIKQATYIHIATTRSNNNLPALAQSFCDELPVDTPLTVARMTLICLCCNADEPDPAMLHLQLDTDESSCRSCHPGRYSHDREVTTISLTMSQTLNAVWFIIFDKAIRCVED